ncbi:MAG: pyruvate, water dikinase regulatory protein [Thermodesulfobacteriota bacterium]
MTVKRPVQVYVISDATGITAERVTQAVLVQFSRKIEPHIERLAPVKTTKQLERILARAEESRGLVVYSLVAEHLRDYMDQQKRRRKIELWDLLGPLLHRLSHRFKTDPSLHPGLLFVEGEQSIRLAATIDFTLRHDDGNGEATLGQAELIIIGVSRTTKTPTSLFLACNHNLRVANVPLILGLEPPAKLFSLKRPRKVGFIIAAEKLAQIRRSRYGGQAVEGYTDIRQIREELAYSRQVFARLPGLQVIDVTNRPIEEVANLILEGQGLG